MRHVDFSPLYRSTVGFDRLFTMLDSLGQLEGGQTYPPYNIERTAENAYRISMAVAGFSEEDISVEAHRNVLTIKGEKKDEQNEEQSDLLYRGIASRSFERRFQLADQVYRPGLAKLLDRIVAEDVTNVRMVEANAPEVLDHMLPAGAAQEVWVFFPDPWQKNRYHKRRLIQPKFLDRVARVLKVGGVLRLATDWSHYAAHMREVAEAHPAFENLHPGRLAGHDSPLTRARAKGTDEHNPLPLAEALDTEGGWAPRFATRPVTSFEAKAQRAGRYIFDLAYRRI